MAYLDKLISDIRIEINDKNKTVWIDDEIIRSIEKTVSLMSRLTPKRAIIETTIVRDINDETLTIASSTGTLAYKPIKPGSVVMTGKTLDTDYRINYLTGVVTEIGSLLPDTDYTVSYDLDDHMFDLSTLLTDYIKLERVECPVGDDPLTLVAFDVFGDFLVLRGSANTLDEDKHLRIIYLKKWTMPTPSADGDYPSHLDDVVVVGSSGQALIYKAENCVNNCVTNITAVATKLAEIDGLSLTLSTLTAPTAPTLTFPDPPASPTVSDVTAPTAPTLESLSAPTDYSLSQPSSPSLPSAPSAPSAPSLSFTAVETALAAVATEITAAKAHITSGAALVNTGTRGEGVAATYGDYADTVMDACGHRVNEAIGRLRQIEEDLTKYASQVTSYGSDVNSYANEISGTIGKYREDINNELAGIQNFQVQLAKYKEQVDFETVKVNKYAQEVNGYEAEIAEERMVIEKYQQDIASYQAQLQELALSIQKYSNQVSNYQIEVSENQQLIQSYDTQVNAKLNYAAQLNNQVTNYLSIAGRYLASGQSKINEFLTALGVKAEFVSSKGSSETRA